MRDRFDEVGCGLGGGIQKLFFFVFSNSVVLFVVFAFPFHCLVAQIRALLTYFYFTFTQRLFSFFFSFCVCTFFFSFFFGFCALSCGLLIDCCLIVDCGFFYYKLTCTFLWAALFLWAANGQRMGKGRGGAGRRGAGHYIH